MSSEAMFEEHLEELETHGYCVLLDALSADELAPLARALDDLEDQEHQGIVFNLIARGGPFIDLFDNPRVHPLLEAWMGTDTFITTSYNGVSLRRDREHLMGYLHRDSGRFIPGYRYAISIFYMIDEFTTENGATWVVPDTHLIEERLSDAYLDAHKVQVTGNAGSAIIMDGNLWHCTGINRTATVRRNIVHIFCRSFFRTQFDFVRSVSDDVLERLSERGRKLLGYHVRMPTSMEEYALPGDERIYRSGQG